MTAWMPVVKVVVIGTPFACMFIVLAIIGLGPAFTEVCSWWRARCRRH
jgi:hypothetical protein